MVDDKEKKWTDSELIDAYNAGSNNAMNPILFPDAIQWLQQYKESKQKYSNEQYKAVDMGLKEYEIRITGSGDKYYIIESLEKIIEDMKWSPEDIGDTKLLKNRKMQLI